MTEINISFKIDCKDERVNELIQTILKAANPKLEDLPKKKIDIEEMEYNVVQVPFNDHAITTNDGAKNIY